jgi:hypothetical protein
VGLEAWWSWAGETQSSAAAAQERRRADCAKRRALDAKQHALARTATPVLSARTMHRHQQQQQQQQPQLLQQQQQQLMQQPGAGDGADEMFSRGLQPAAVLYEHPAIAFKHPDAIPVAKRRPWYSLLPQPRRREASMCYLPPLRRGGGGQPTIVAL